MGELSHQLHARVEKGATAGRPDLHRELATHIVPAARKAWTDLQNPDDGCVRCEHDDYLKIWALTRPKLDADYLLLDEAQDTNPVVEQVFLAQRDHAQLVMVGDSAQAIYQWRGAKDVMTDFHGAQLTLSQSFRFGPHLAEEANRWLRLADAPIRLTGSPTVPTEIGPVTSPDAVLCRTNVGAMAQVMTLMTAGFRVALAGGGDGLRALAQAARDLKEGRHTHHPELVLFPSWGDLQDYAAHDPAGRDLQPLVNVVDAHGTDVILAAVAQLVPQPHAQVTISTAHKAKGREWPCVLIADDFRRPQSRQLEDHSSPAVNYPVDDAEARLAYVAVTRTRQRLDLGGLSWIRDNPDIASQDQPAAAY
ncbi:ATP-dependent DNA helicase Rep [Streptomyces sp. RB17]|nr:ATP-dependent DNA helicase Rep [Streptomyces sp. RB17]